MCRMSISVFNTEYLCEGCVAVEYLVLAKSHACNYAVIS